jgi:hypothetical protein
MLQANKKNAALALVGGAMLALSANAHALLGLPLPLPHTIMTFEFNGEFTMFDPMGAVVNDPMSSPAITGTIMLDAFTFGGTAAMDGAFFGSPWTANGDLSAYIGLLAGDKCGGAPMCAHSNIDFAWNGNLIPVQAAFGMTPVLPGLTDLLSLNVGAEFAVESIDTEPDGIMGTAMSVGPFVGFTPYFTGTATLVGINLLGSPIANPDICISPVPEPSEWAMMLVGVGLIGTMAHRRKQAQAVSA